MSSKSRWWEDASGCGGCVSNYLLALLLLLGAIGPRENFPSCFVYIAFPVLSLIFMYAWTFYFHPKPVTFF